MVRGKGNSGQLPYQGAWNNNKNGWGYQGICWKCGNIGHKSFDCRKVNEAEVGGGDNQGSGEPEKGSDAMS
eukprot:1573073-Karenia_brevis.AAC.1